MLQVRGAVSGALIAALISALASPKLFADEPETFWAFQTLSSPQAPTVHGQHRTAVDAFVLAKLEEKQLELAPEADRRTILRRAHLDLIGLPPTPTETEAFLADASADPCSNPSTSSGRRADTACQRASAVPTAAASATRDRRSWWGSVTPPGGSTGTRRGRRWPPALGPSSRVLARLRPDRRGCRSRW